MSTYRRFDSSTPHRAHCKTGERVAALVDAVPRAGELDVPRIDSAQLARLATFEVARRPTVAAIEAVMLQLSPPYGLFVTVRHDDGRREQQGLGRRA